MRKALIEKKLRKFKELFPDHEISKKSGSIYTVLNSVTNTRNVVIGPHSITKGMLDRVNEKREWVETSKEILLLTSKGVMFHKPLHYKRFKRVSLKMVSKWWRGDLNIKRPHELPRVTNSILNWWDDVQGTPQKSKEKTELEREELTKKNEEFYSKVVNGIAQIFFIGKKCEWMFKYPNIWDIRYFTGFNSAKEAKNYLGYNFISESDFYSLLRGNNQSFGVMVTARRSEEEKVNLIHLLRNDHFISLNDYIRMAEGNGHPWKIPRGVNKLTELHDREVFISNKGKIEEYSPVKTYYLSQCFRIWNDLKLTYKVLDSPRAMYLEGVKQSHCIGSYCQKNSNKVSSDSMFVRFEWKDSAYDIQINMMSGSKIQFKGKHNTPAPKDLVDLVGQGLDLPIGVTMNGQMYQDGELCPYNSVKVPIFGSDVKYFDKDKKPLPDIGGLVTSNIGHGPGLMEFIRPTPIHQHANNDFRL
jgi:hypothetical protein